MNDNKNIHDFHFLIEIIVRLREAQKDPRNGIAEKCLQRYWEKKADDWIKENYNKDGIDWEEMRMVFTKEKNITG